VRVASAALVDALNAHDADSILAFYSSDDDFTQLACTSFVFGGASFASLTRSLHANYRDAVYDMAIRDVLVLGPNAAVVSLEGTMLGPLFVTRVLRRGDSGRWLVVWEHESWPGCPGPTSPHP
jgi:ketosteroid isomerase-like protein